MGTLDGETITLKWADVPRSASAGSGDMTIQVEADASGNLRLTKTEGGDNFGASHWQPCTEDGGAASATLPRDGVYEADITSADLRAAGAYPDAATFLAGKGTWTFDNGKFSLGAGQLDAASCGGTYSAVHGLVRLRFASPRGCQGMDDVRFFPSDDGNSMTAEFVVCGPLGCDARDDRAIFERTWTRVGDAPTPTIAATIGEAADDGARIVNVDDIDARTRDLTIESPSVGTVTARLILPSSYGDEATATWPVLFLLHGCCDTPDSWMRETDVEALTAPTDLMVVTPDGGDQGWYTDWTTADPDAPFGPNQWETFHLTELPQLLERNYRASDNRVIAGLSMGGYGALNYASRHPEMFKAAASYSGVLDLKVNPWDFTDPDSVARWGDPVVDAANWDQHDPVKFVDRLKGMPLYVAYGNGQPGPLDVGVTDTDGLEEWIGQGSDAFVAALKAAGVPAIVNAYGAGTHSWAYWQRDLHESLPMLLRALGEPVPASSGAPTTSAAP